MVLVRQPSAPLLLRRARARVAAAAGGDGDERGEERVNDDSGERVVVVAAPDPGRALRMTRAQDLYDGLVAQSVQGILQAEEADDAW